MRTDPIRTRVLLAAVVALLATSATSPAEEVVHFRTDDRLEIEGSYWPAARQGSPGVVLVHMAGSDRTAWKLLAPLLAKAGMNVLAIDLRGHGGSAKQGNKDLSEAARSGDKYLHRAMVRDVLAAVGELKRLRSDPHRIAVLGAGLGCSVAVDAAVRDPEIRGAVLLTPGRKLGGLDTMGHVRKWGERPMLVLSSKAEAGSGPQAIADALGKRAELRLYDREDIRGTDMLGRVPEVEGAIAVWLRDLLGAPFALDGEVAPEESAGGDLGVWDMKDDGEGRIYLRTRGRWLYAAVKLAGTTGPPSRFLFAWAPDGKPERGRRLYCNFITRRQIFALQPWKDGRWWTGRDVWGKVPEAGRWTGRSPRGIEVLLPRSLPGLEKECRLRIAFGLVGMSTNIPRVLPPGDQDMTRIDTWIEFLLP